MTLLKKTTLAWAIAACSMGAQAASFSSFYEDASVSGKLRTVYYDIEKAKR